VHELFNCGKKLTAKEIEYYENSCENCQGEIMAALNDTSDEAIMSVLCRVDGHRITPEQGLEELKRLIGDRA
jgi:hypothetical protein